MRAEPVAARDTEFLENNRGTARRHRSRTRDGDRAVLDQCERFVGGSPAVLGSMELHADAAQWPVDVRREQQHGQSGAQADLAENQTKADADCDQGDAKGGKKF